ncbi:MAG TPA: hypothetical protein VFV34_25070, partial [Blastocatellia bacterium]|nr:hypothetical protein [Blastocatellia bacterium]
SRTWEIGGGNISRTDKGQRLTLNVRANNLFNRANLSAIGGVLNSPFFGVPSRAAPARRIEVGVRFGYR